jgi:hypothetical protein
LDGVADYIDGLAPPEQAIVDYLCHLFVAYPGVRLQLKHRIPFICGRSWICYLNALKKGGVELAFIRGQAMDDPFGMLQSRGRKMVRGVAFLTLEAIPEEPVRVLFESALLLDQRGGGVVTT